MKLIIEKQDLIKRLVERAILGTYEKKPGKLIEKLSKEDREICKELTSNDFNHRI
jgi:hypothetical protein